MFWKPDIQSGAMWGGSRGGSFLPPQPLGAPAAPGLRPHPSSLCLQVSWISPCVRVSPHFRLKQGYPSSLGPIPTQVNPCLRSLSQVHLQILSFQKQKSQSETKTKALSGHVSLGGHFKGTRQPRAGRPEQRGHRAKATVTSRVDQERSGCRGPGQGFQAV